MGNYLSCLYNDKLSLILGEIYLLLTVTVLGITLKYSVSLLAGVIPYLTIGYSNNYIRNHFIITKDDIGRLAFNNILDLESNIYLDI